MCLRSETAKGRPKAPPQLVPHLATTAILSPCGDNTQELENLQLLLREPRLSSSVGACQSQSRLSLHQITLDKGIRACLA
jgi:hypothetical protein